MRQYNFSLKNTLRISFCLGIHEIADFKNFQEKVAVGVVRRLPIAVETPSILRDELSELPR